MLKRTLFAAAFAIGGIFTLLILLVLHGFGQSQGGMSASSISSSGPSDTAITFVVCGYFFLSAIGISVANNKAALRLWAAAVHALLIIAYVMIFISVKNNDSDGSKWLVEMGQFSIIMATYFSPWLIVWGIMLSSMKDDEPKPRQ